MPRRSAAELAIVTVDGSPRRLQPPRYLRKAARMHFIEIVNAVSPKHFVDSDRPLITSLAMATAKVHALEKDPSKITQWERAVRAQVMLARSLRLTPQSRIDPRSVSRRMPSGPSSAYDTMREDDDDAD